MGSHRQSSIALVLIFFFFFLLLEIGCLRLFPFSHCGRRLRSSNLNDQGGFTRASDREAFEEQNMNQVARSTVPSRSDTCKILISGDIGTEPREAYLKNGHYVLNFALAVVGHFAAVHEWEKFKPTETMWIQVEVWDELAKKNFELLQKGRRVSGIGALIHQKWIDKSTGDERKQFKLRLLKLIPSSELTELMDTVDDTKAFPQLSMAESSSFSSDLQSDSGFSSTSPRQESQIWGEGSNDMPLEGSEEATSFDKIRQVVTEMSATSQPQLHQSATPQPQWLQLESQSSAQSGSKWQYTSPGEKKSWTPRNLQQTKQPEDWTPVEAEQMDHSSETKRLEKPRIPLERDIAPLDDTTLDAFAKKFPTWEAVEENIGSGGQDSGHSNGNNDRNSNRNSNSKTSSSSSSDFNSLDRQNID